MKRWVVPMVVAGLLTAGCTGPDLQLRARAIGEFQVGHVDEAKVLFSQALGRNPSDPVALYYLGRIAYAKADYEDAIYYFQCCVDSDPSYAEAYGWLSRAQKAAGSAGKLLRFIP
jgi:tetratricopeptide (TPR) repeat protein